MTLRLANISKQFGPTVALANVSFELRAGEVHALLGENGAGKSTLLQIASGITRPDNGTIVIQVPGAADFTTNGFASPREARARGLGLVHQHFSSIPALTVAENIALTGGWVDTGRAAERRADELTRRLGLDLPVAEYVDGLSVQLRQRLEIVKALAADARILLLDEPTAVLAPREIGELMGFVRSFAAGGGAVALITHKLDEVFQAADRVTVLRRGVVVLHGALNDESPHSLSRAMIGAELTTPSRTPSEPGAVVVRAAYAQFGAARDGDRRTPPATFEFRSGEVIGIAAIEGNGQRELLRAIAGVAGEVPVAGSLDVDGVVAFVPEDRIAEGVIGSFTLTENLVLGGLSGPQRWIDWSDARSRTASLLQANDVRAPNPDVTASKLSGGNQQKFILGRALALRPRVIVAEDPSRGLDVLATAVVHSRLRDAAREGAAVIVHSSDLDEVLALADRLFVVARGVLTELPIDTPRGAVGDAMLALGTPT